MKVILLLAGLMLTVPPAWAEYNATPPRTGEMPVPEMPEPESAADRLESRQEMMMTRISDMENRLSGVERELRRNEDRIRDLTRDVSDLRRQRR